MKIHTTLKRVYTIMLTLLVLLSLCGCCLQHNWQPATCTEPETCSKCGKTRGEPLGHKWIPATCTEAKTCSVCGVTEGEPLGHSYAASGDKFLCTRCKEEEVFSYYDMNDVLYGIADDYSTFYDTYTDKSMVMQIQVTEKYDDGTTLVDSGMTLRTIQNPNNKSESIDVQILYEPKNEAEAAKFKEIDDGFTGVTIRATLDKVLNGFFDGQYIIYFDNAELISDGWEKIESSSK